MAKRNYCAIIPAFNEEEVISASLKSLKKVFKPDDIYVVSDGSTDKTVKKAVREAVNVLDLQPNKGKALAQKKVIEVFRLAKRYKYIFFTDADSKIDGAFLKEIKKCLSADPALIVGTVTSDRRGLISAFRTYEYGLSHRIYKNAQNIMETIAVAPGCASLYKSKVLEKLDLNNNTLTEDFDLTIQIHQRKLGRIIYAAKAKVTTQDPMTLRDYWKQILRWNIGTWQNIMMHRLYKPNTRLNIELYFLMIDNFLMLASIILAIRYPLALLYVLVALCLSVYVFAITVGLVEKKYWILRYVFIFPIFYGINLAAYFYSIYRAIRTKKQKPLWQKVTRYNVG